jgi:hypothetical protein
MPMVTLRRSYSNLAVEVIYRLAVAVLMVGASYSACGQPNIYHEALRAQLGPQIIRDHRWAEVWVMAATNDYFRRNPTATIIDYNREFGPALDYLQKGPHFLSDLEKTGVNIMKEFVPTLPGTGVLISTMADAAFQSQYDAMDRVWSFNLQTPGVFKIADILTDGEACVANRACRSAYSEVLHDAKLADSVKDVVDAYQVTRVHGLSARTDDPRNQILHLRAEINSRRGAARGQATADDRKQLQRLEAASVKEFIDQAQKFREETEKLRGQLTAQAEAQRHQRNVDNMRASAYLLSTVVGFIDPIAGQKLGRAGEAFTQIVDAVGRRGQISQVVLTANVLQGALTVASMLSDQGPSFEQETLSALREIQQQIASLRADMERGFTGLNWKLDQMYVSLSMSLEAITNRTVAINAGIADLQAKAREIADLVEQARAENRAIFRNLDRQMLAQNADCFNGLDITDGKFATCRAFLGVMLDGGAAGPQYVITEDPAQNPPTERMLGRPTPEVAGYLARYAAQKQNLNLDGSSFPHLAVWSQFAGTYVSVLQSYPEKAHSQAAAVARELQDVIDVGNRADGTLRTLADHEKEIFSDALAAYTRAANGTELALRRTYVTSIRTAGNTSALFPGEQYFADHLAGGQLAAADYQRFGAPNQNRSSFTAPSAALFACPPGTNPTQNNDTMRPHSLDQTIAFPKPLFALYGTNLSIPATTPASFSTIVPPSIRMYADLTGRDVGLCVSDVNWVRAGQLKVGFAAINFVNLRITVDAFVGNPGPTNYDAAKVFARVSMDTSGIVPNGKLWSFDDADAGGGHGDHLVHRLHNFVFGTDNKQPMVQALVNQIGTPGAQATPDPAVIAAVEQETSQILSERQYVYASTVSQLLGSKDGRVDGVTLGGDFAELYRSFENWKTTYLLVDRYAALLLSRSYAADRGLLATAIGALDPDAFTQALTMFARTYSCAHPSPADRPCTVTKAPSGAPIDFVSGTPLLASSRRGATVGDFVYTVVTPAAAAAAAAAIIDARFADAKSATVYEPIEAFALAREMLTVEQQRRVVAGASAKH